MRESRLELLESGSSTPASTERADDVDSVSVTTSSSSDVTAGSSRQDRGLGPTDAAAVARPRPSAGRSDHPQRTQDPLTGSASRPVYLKDENEAHDSGGFLGNEVIRRPAESHPLQPPSRVPDAAGTHHVSVELHAAPRGFAGPDAASGTMI